jgi:hypothetical protein
MSYNMRLVRKDNKLMEQSYQCNIHLQVGMGKNRLVLHIHSSFLVEYKIDKR